MTWTKLSDDYSDDCWTLSDAAFRLHTEGLIWSNRELLDCVIPKDDLRRFAKRPEAVKELVAGGYWTEPANAYIIRHHASYQRLKEAVLRQQEANKENGSKGGRSPREPFDPPRKTESLTESQTETEIERDRTGQDWPRRGSSSEERIDWVTGEVSPSSECSVCGKELTTAVQMQRGICNPCKRDQLAEQRRREAAS